MDHARSHTRSKGYFAWISNFVLNPSWDKWCMVALPSSCPLPEKTNSCKVRKKLPLLGLWSFSSVFVVPLRTPWLGDSSKSSTSIGILSASNPLSIQVPLETNPFVAEDELLPILPTDPALYECEGLTLGLERGLWAAGRTSLSHPLTISTNCRHFKRKSKFGFRSKSPGYNVCVVSIASPILPARTSFCIPERKKQHLADSLLYHPEGRTWCSGI